MPQTFESLYRARLGTGVTGSLYGAFAFDAMLSIAQTLNQSLALLNGASLTDFAYDVTMAQLFDRVIRGNVFNGLTVNHIPRLHGAKLTRSRSR